MTDNSSEKFPAFERMLTMDSTEFLKRIREIDTSLGQNKSQNALVELITQKAILEVGKTALDSYAILGDPRAKVFMAMSVCLRTAVDMGSLYPEFDDRLLDMIIGWEKVVQDRRDAALAEKAKKG